MIKVVEKKKKKKKQTPYYLLEFSYMIGDCDGDTGEEMTAPIEDAEIVERFVKLINSLEPTSGNWGIVFSKYEFKDFLTEGQITEDDYEFLNTVMFSVNRDGKDNKDNKYLDYNGYFSECIQGDVEYSFLVFEGVDLYYYDEHGVKHETEIVD